jgi:hypothetical protein
MKTKKKKKKRARIIHYSSYQTVLTCADLCGAGEKRACPPDQHPFGVTQRTFSVCGGNNTVETPGQGSKGLDHHLARQHSYARAWIGHWMGWRGTHNQRD